MSTESKLNEATDSQLRADALEYHAAPCAARSKPSPPSPSRTSATCRSRIRRAWQKQLRERMNIPVFHDDQHGTAIISSAALLNALKVAGKDIGKVKLVASGAGAAAIACLDMMVSLGVNRHNIGAHPEPERHGAPDRQHDRAGGRRGAMT